MLSTVDEADRAAAEHFPSQDDMDAAMEDFLKQLEQEVSLENLNNLLCKLQCCARLRQAATCTRSTYGCGSLEGEDQGLEAEMWLILNEDGRSVCSGGSRRDGRPEKEGRKQGKLMQWGNKLQCALIYINVY